MMVAKTIICALSLLLLSAVTIAEVAQPLSSGQLNYMLQCQGCHKANGAGIDGSVPDLRKYGRQLLQAPEGRQYFVSVPGSANAPLSDKELAGVLNFIISDILNVPDSANDPIARFSADEVASYRPIRIPDVGRLRATLIKLLKPAGDINE